MSRLSSPEDMSVVLDRGSEGYTPRRMKRRISSLVELCIVTLINNIEEASIEALESLPAGFDERLWRRYATKCDETIRGWRLFSAVLLKHMTRVPLQLYWFRQQVLTPSVHDLPRYVQLSTSPSVDFVTHLTLHKVWMFRASDLMALAEMQNLGILELSDLFGKPQHDPKDLSPAVVDSVLNDRLVRGWSEKEKPFPNLRVLCITSVHSSISMLALQYASRFPSLVYCALRSVALPDGRGSAEREATKLGWRMEITLNPWEKLHGPDPKFQGLDLWKDLPSRGKEAGRQNPIVNEDLLERFYECPVGGVFLAPSSTDGTKGPDAVFETPGNGQSVPDMKPPLEDYIIDHRQYNNLPWLQSGWSLYSALGDQIGDADLVQQGVRLPQRATHIAPVPWCEDSPHKRRRQAPAPWARREVLPPKQMLHVELGSARRDYLDLRHTMHIPGYYNNSLYTPGHRVGGFDSEEMKQYTFVRDWTPTMSTGAASAPPAGETALAEESGPSGSSGRRKNTSGRSRFKPRKRRDLDGLFRF